MSGKRVVSRNVALGAAGLCVVLLCALIFSVAYFALALRDKDALIASLNSEIVALGGDPSQSQGGSDKDALIAALQDELVRLNGEISGLCAAKLVSVGLKAEDNRPNSQSPYVLVSGYVVNFGNSTANDAKIHVVLQQSGGVVAKDTYINLGSIAGESFATVDMKVYYEGSAITFASMNLEWT
jgi:hypothetical protein